MVWQEGLGSIDVQCRATTEVHGINIAVLLSLINSVAVMVVLLLVTSATDVLVVPISVDLMSASSTNILVGISQLLTVVVDRKVPAAAASESRWRMPPWGLAAARAAIARAAGATNLIALK